VTRVNTNIVHNTYVNNSFTRNVNANRTSFNGGNGGIKAEANAQQKAAAANAKKVGPTEQQLSRQQLARKDQNLRASANKGKPNADAIKSFDKNNGAALGKAGEQGPEAAAGAGAGKGENKIGNEVNRQGAGQGQGGNKIGNAGAGKGGNKPGNVTERNLQGAGKGKTAGAGNGGANGNKLKTGNQGNNMRTAGGNQAKMHTGKGGGAANGPHTMNKMSHNPQMGTRNPQMGARSAQMGGKRPPTGGGNRPAPKGQPQGKKKPGQR
jgi:hypothetical protein